MRLIDADKEIEKIKQEIQRTESRIEKLEKEYDDRNGYHDMDGEITRLHANITEALIEIKCLENYKTAYDVGKVISKLDKCKQIMESPVQQDCYNEECKVGDCIVCAFEKAIEIVKAGATE